MAQVWTARVAESGFRGFAAPAPAGRTPGGLASQQPGSRDAGAARSHPADATTQSTQPGAAPPVAVAGPGRYMRRRTGDAAGQCRIPACP